MNVQLFFFNLNNLSLVAHLLTKYIGDRVISRLEEWSIENQDEDKYDYNKRDLVTISIEIDKIGVKDRGFSAYEFGVIN